MLVLGDSAGAFGCKASKSFEKAVISGEASARTDVVGAIVLTSLWTSGASELGVSATGDTAVAGAEVAGAAGGILTMVCDSLSRRWAKSP